MTNTMINMNLKNQELENARISESDLEEVSGGWNHWVYSGSPKNETVGYWIVR